MAKVEYIDYEAFSLPALPYPVYYKRKSFDHEREPRLAILDSHTGSSLGGVLVNVDFERLMQRVYVSPTAPKWQNKS